MEKLEYIPGDLVFHYIPKTTIKKYVKVYVCSTNNALSLEDMDGNLYDYIGVLYPIPLTSEILEKNGWKSINGKYALKIKNANYVVLEFTEDGIYTYINENTMLFTIKYIHELQHLLYALHIDSNLKI
jgi:hypothetical protein